MIFSPALKETSPSNSAEKATSVKRNHSSCVRIQVPFLLWIFVEFLRTTAMLVLDVYCQYSSPFWILGGKNIIFNKFSRQSEKGIYGIYHIHQAE